MNIALEIAGVAIAAAAAILSVFSSPLSRPWRIANLGAAAEAAENIYRRLSEDHDSREQARKIADEALDSYLAGATKSPRRLVTSLRWLATLLLLIVVLWYLTAGLSGTPRDWELWAYFACFAIGLGALWVALALEAKHPKEAEARKKAGQGQEITKAEKRKKPGASKPGPRSA